MDRDPSKEQNLVGRRSESFDDFMADLRTILQAPLTPAPKRDVYLDAMRGRQTLSEMRQRFLESDSDLSVEYHNIHSANRVNEFNSILNGLISIFLSCSLQVLVVSIVICGIFFFFLLHVDSYLTFRGDIDWCVTQRYILQ